MNERELLVQVLVSVWDALPSLVGPAWPAFEAELLVRLRALEASDPDDDEGARNAVIDLFDRSPPARQRLLESYAALAPRLDRATPLGRHPAGAIRHVRHVEVPVFFATDRAPAADAKAAPFFTGDRGPGDLTFGVVHVSIPDDHRTGGLEKPRWWKLQFRRDPERFILVVGMDLHDRRSFVTHARGLLRTAVLPEALIFIHGYNVRFEDAALRCAQITYDLHFEGLTLLYSWPSEGAAIRYPVDRGNAIWSLPHFRNFLSLVLSEVGATSVHAIAHSMGNEVLVNGLAAFDVSALPEGSAALRQIVFAAPDIDASTFRDLAAQFHTRAERCTLYASSKDKALLASQGLQKYPRAGQAGDGLVLVGGVDTIDATDLDTGLMGHSYIGDRTSILSDVHYLIRHGAPPGERFGLEPVEGLPLRYWRFLPSRA